MWAENLEQLLLELYRTKKLVRNLDTGEWTYRKADLDTLDVTNNVVELMRKKLDELPAATQKLLGLAACAGHSFTLEELTVMSGLSAQAVAEALWPAMREGMVVAMDSQCRYAQALAEENELHGQLPGRYQFLHDRVQQACYEGISATDRTRAHLDIGRRLRARYESQGGTTQELLELLRHLNLSLGAIESEEERRKLAQLNLLGARKAKASSAYHLMPDLLEQGIRLAGQSQWQDNPTLAVELAIERVEAAYLLRAFEKVHDLTQPLLERELAQKTRWTLHELRLRACLSSGQFAKGTELGSAIFAEDGKALPKSEQERIAEVALMLKECRAWADRIGEAGLAALPLDSDPVRALKDAARFSWAHCTAASGSMAGHGWIVSSALHELLKKQTKTLFSPLMMAFGATIWGPLFDEPREAAKWALDAFVLLRDLETPAALFTQTIGHCVLLYLQHPRKARPAVEQVIRMALDCGDLTALSGGCYCLIRDCLLWPGEPLAEVHAEIEQKQPLVRRSGDVLGQHALEFFRAFSNCLQQNAAPVADETGELLSFGSRELFACGDALSGSMAWVFETQLFLMTRDLKRAFERGCDAAKNRMLMSIVPLGSDIPMNLGLAAAALVSDQLPPDKRVALEQHLAQAVKHFRYLSEGCPENFAHKLRLLEAEQARLAGRMDEAIVNYDAAIDLARQHGFLHIEALAAQLCGEFHHKAQRRRFATIYFQEARDAYQRWGAQAMAHFMVEHYPDYFSKPGPETAAAPWLNPGKAAQTTTTINARTLTSSVRSASSSSLSIETETAVRAAQTLASELTPTRIVSELMRLVIESAGAQRGVLLLGHEDALVVTARLNSVQSLIEAGLHTPLSACSEVAHGMVDAVVRTRQSLLLPDAPADERFRSEARLSLSQTRAVLVTPLVHQARLVGVLYLEHDERDAFTYKAVNLVVVLAAQAATALENARLYEDLQRSNVSLETQVAARTAELQTALSELWGEMDLATKIQTVLLPADGIYGGHQIAASMRPADKVGGDYYDVFQHAGATWVLVGDVSGHGVSAGLIMMMVQSAIRTLVCAKPDQAPSPAEVLAQVNFGIASNLQKIDKGQYMSIVAMCIDGRKACYAGLHPDLLIYRKSEKTVEQIALEGVYLGMIEDASELFANRTLDFAPDDLLLFHTDGLTEARKDGSLLGIDSTVTLLKEKGMQNATPQEITHAVFGLLEGTHCNDDVTVLTMRIG